MRESAQFVTTCDDTIELDPWISWPTLHRGVTDAQHKILSLGQILDGIYVNYDMYAGEHVGYIGNQSMSFDDLGIGFIPHEDGVSVTAHHHPDGILMIYDPKRPQKGLRQRISTLEIAPALLECYGIVPPDYMIRPGAAMRVALSNRAMV